MLSCFLTGYHKPQINQIHSLIILLACFTLARSQVSRFCTSQEDCDASQSCVRLECVDPCTVFCGSNTVCTVTNHVAKCSCRTGFVGDPQVGCQQKSKTCIIQSDCEAHLTCVRHECIDPCLTLCGANTICLVQDHKETCTCRPGYTGDSRVYCKQSCGSPVKIEETKSALVPLIFKGQSTKRGEFPWLAGIFLKNETNQWAQVCGATLVSSHLVVTAAHCLKSNSGTVVQPDEIKVGLGKYHRDFYTNEKYSIISDVKQIIIPNNYVGESSSYAVDIGLLDLAVKVEVSAFIQPACLAWDFNVTIQSGDTGYVAGWGTTETGSVSQTVLTAQLVYMEHNECMSKLQFKYKRFLTHDKFCAGSINGGQADRGDSGGGLTFVKDGRHFLLGVVSTKIRGETSFSLFTDLQNLEHVSWLKQQNSELVVLDKTS